MRRRPPRSTRPDTLLPYTTHFLSQSDHQPKREHGIHQRFSELRALGIFMIAMDRRRVVAQRTEKHIVEVGYRLADFVDEFLPHTELLEMQTCPLVSPPSPRPRSEEHTSELHPLMRLSYAVLCLT